MCIHSFQFEVTMRALRLCIILLLKMFPEQSFSLPSSFARCLLRYSLLPQASLSLSLDIFFQRFSIILLNSHGFRNIRPSFPSFSAILLNSVHNVQVRGTQSHVRLHRFLESVFPITIRWQKKLDCVFTFRRLLHSIVEKR